MIVALVAGIAGVLAMSFLMRTAGAGRTATGDPVATVMPDWSRRSFLIRAGAVGVGAMVAGVLGRGPPRAPARRPPRRHGPPSRRASVDVPALDRRGPRTTIGPDPDRHAQRPLLPDRHRAPDPDRRHRASWTLRIHGMVDRETTLTWERAHRRCRCSSST